MYINKITKLHCLHSSARPWWCSGHDLDELPSPGSRSHNCRWANVWGPRDGDQESHSDYKEEFKGGVGKHKKMCGPRRICTGASICSLLCCISWTTIFQWAITWNLNFLAAAPRITSSLLVFSVSLITYLSACLIWQFIADFKLNII